MSILILSLLSNAVVLSNFNSVFNSVAFAQSVDKEVGDGINPDSFFYGLDVFIDDIVLAFTSGDVEKAKLSLKIAEERLQEVKLMIEENKLSASQAAQAEHDKMLSVTEDAISQIESADAVEEMKEKIEVERELKEHKTKVEKISDELKVKIKIKGEITAEQQSLIDSILIAMEGKTGEVEIEIDNEKQETKIKIKQQTGKTDEEVEDEIEELEIEAGVAEEESEEGETELKAILLDSAGNEVGEAEFEMEDAESELNVKLEDAAPDSEFSITIGVTLLTEMITTDTDGEGEIELEPSPLVVAADDVISVDNGAGDVYTGTFAAEDEEEGEEGAEEESEEGEEEEAEEEEEIEEETEETEEEKVQKTLQKTI